MKELIFASSNAGKYKEVESVAAEFGLSILRPEKLMTEKDLPSPPRVSETGSSYRANARLKAQAFVAWSGTAALADDTGLEVHALGGRPGLYSSRFAGPQENAADNITMLLRVMDGVMDRRALFRCLLCLVLESGEELESEAVINGTIGTARRGGGGFGYDSLFVVDGYGGLTLAELKEQGRAVETHRILACRRLFEQLRLHAREPARDRFSCS